MYLGENVVGLPQVAAPSIHKGSNGKRPLQGGAPRPAMSFLSLTGQLLQLQASFYYILSLVV
jgi:hypothetical protein